MIELINNQLWFRFPAVHPDARCGIEFQRTLRLPDDDKVYPLPPGFGRFPLHHVDDYLDQVRPQWRARGGVFLPMYQSEAMWLGFSGSYPFALKIATGKINAVTGAAWEPGLNAQSQDYIVMPDQPWIDGYAVAPGLIRQFVAQPLGARLSAEEQLAGVAEHGGIQLAAYPMKQQWYMDWLAHERSARVPLGLEGESRIADPADELGVAAGGHMRQAIFQDPYGVEAWDTTQVSRCFVHLLNVDQYIETTRLRPPATPVNAREYSDAGLPWYDYYDGDAAVLAGSADLAQLPHLPGHGTDDTLLEPRLIRDLGAVFDDD